MSVRIINLIRLIGVGLVFGLVWQFGGEFTKGWILGLGLVAMVIRLEGLIQIDDTQSLFVLAELVPSVKEQLLAEVKKSGIDRLKGLTVDGLTYEEVIMPDLPNNNKNKDGEDECS